MISGERGQGKTARILNISRAVQTVSHSVGRLTENERSFIENQLFVEARRFSEQQLEIGHVTFLRDFFQWSDAADRYIDDKEWYKRYWRAIARIESKILVRRKGTVRSGSRNGSQVCCTHVIAIHDSDVTTRWLVGLQLMFDRGQGAVRNLFNCVVSIWATAHNRRGFKNNNFELCAA